MCYRFRCCHLIILSVKRGWYWYVHCDIGDCSYRCPVSHSEWFGTNFPKPIADTMPIALPLLTPVTQWKTTFVSSEEGFLTLYRLSNWAGGRENAAPTSPTGKEKEEMVI